MLPAAKPATDFRAFFGCEAEASVTAFDDSSRDSIPPTKEIERCLLLIESTELMTIEELLIGLRKVVTAVMSLLDGRPESRV